MSQIFLESFYIVAALNRDYCVCMPQIMETSVWQTDVIHYALEAVIDSSVRKITASVIAEHHVVIFPLVSGIYPQQCLSWVLIPLEFNRASLRQTKESGEQNVKGRKQ